MAISYLCWNVCFKKNSRNFYLPCKFLGDSPCELEILKALLQGINTQGPDPAKISWEPIILDTPKGSVPVLLIHGCPASMNDCHKALSGLRGDDFPEWKPHITINSALWREIKNKGLQPQDLGITFGPLLLIQWGQPIYEWKEK